LSKAIQVQTESTGKHRKRSLPEREGQSYFRAAFSKEGKK
jgi:hypothetical protein